MISFKNGNLSVKATQADLKADQAASQLKKAFEEHSVESILIHDSAAYKEPYFTTVGPWVEALGMEHTNCVTRIIIDTPSQPQNRQSSIYIGDLSPLLEAQTGLEELIVSGHFELSEFAHPTLKKAEFTKRAIQVADAETIGSHKCPSLSRLAVQGCEDGVPEGFGETLIKCFASNDIFGLDELYLFNTTQGQEIVQGLCENKLIEKIKVLDLDDYEFGYDPDVTMEILEKNASQLKTLDFLRIPFNSLMDDERERLKTFIPCIENSCPKDGCPADVPWYRPFLPQMYGADDFDWK